MSLRYLIYFLAVCTNVRRIFNHYVSKDVFVNCGKCPSCQQSKANARANRIRNNSSVDTVTLFVTLTYENGSIPYVLVEDLKNRVDEISVYRDRKYYNGKITYQGRVEIDKQIVHYEPDFDVSEMKRVKYYDDRVSVCLYSDLQKFYKRLRQDLYRVYHVEPKFSSFSCSEYGGRTQRAHFHLLLFIPKNQVETYRSAICKAWPYGNKYHSRRFVELVREDASSYVASYVNCGSSLSTFLKKNNFRQKHSYSKGFGVSSQCFSLPSLLEKVNRGTFYYSKRISRDGVPTIVDFPIPKYVVNRYFFQFKGYSRLSLSEVYDVIQFPERLREFRQELDYSDDDLHKIIVRLKNDRDYYCRVTGNTLYDYAIDYERVWRAYKSFAFKQSFKDVKFVSDFLEFYDNNNDYVNGIVRSWSLDSLDLPLDDYIEDFNTFKYRVFLSNNLSELYHKKTKQKMVTNTVMALQGYDV